MARWTDDEKADICDRFERKGETATQIARSYARQGRAATRNAILGVLHRAGKLGNGRDKMQSQPSSAFRVKIVKPALVAPSPAPAGEGDLAYVAPVDIPSASASTFGRNASGERKTGDRIPIRPVGPNARPLLDLDRGRCKFPVGEPAPGEPRLFCGEPAMPEKPYCATCAGYTVSKGSPPVSDKSLARLGRSLS